MSEVTVDKKFIVDLRGKQFCTYAGLLDLAHKTGLNKIETEMLECDKDSTGIVQFVIFKARVTMKDDNGAESSYEGTGDATQFNVNSMIKQHIIRMAETRAIARALRSATNTGMAAFEELGGEIQND
jgi:hypothetical protein